MAGQVACHVLPLDCGWTVLSGAGGGEEGYLGKRKELIEKNLQFSEPGGLSSEAEVSVAGLGAGGRGKWAEG